MWSGRGIGLAGQNTAQILCSIINTEKNTVQHFRACCFSTTMRHMLGMKKFSYHIQSQVKLILHVIKLEFALKLIILVKVQMSVDFYIKLTLSIISLKYLCQIKFAC